MGNCKETSSWPLCSLICRYTPLSVKGGGIAIVGATLVVVAILGRLGKISIPPAGQWALFTGGTMAVICALMCLYFYFHSKN